MRHNRGNRFVNIAILAPMFLLLFGSLVFSQTADEYFEQGKAALESLMLADAHTNFQNALGLEPSHQGANFFYALTNVLMLSESTEFNTLLDRAGVSADGRDIFNWYADFTYDVNGNVIMPTDSPTGAELQGFLQNQVIPALEESTNALDVIGPDFQTTFNWSFEAGEGSPVGINTFQTYSGWWYENEWSGYTLIVDGSAYQILSNTNSVLQVSPNLSLSSGVYDYRIVAPVELDYGDALVIQGGLNLATAGVQIVLSYNINVDIDAIVSQFNAGELNLNTLLTQTYPQVMTLLTPNQMAEAKANVRECISKLEAAVDSIINEVDPQGNDFFDINAEEGAVFTATLTEWNNALDGPVSISSLNTQVDLSQFFDNPKNLKDYSPEFINAVTEYKYGDYTYTNEEVLMVKGSFPDPTFGGILPSLSAPELYYMLEREHLLAPSNNDILIDFGPGPGTWVLYNDTTWTQIHSLSPEIMVQGDLDGDGRDESIMDFGTTYGTYVLNGHGTWAKLHSLSPEIMTIGDLDGNGQNECIMDFGSGYGIWVFYNNQTWVKLHDLSAEIIEAGDLDGNGTDDCIVDFGEGIGVWVWHNGSGWEKLHSLSPKAMAVGKSYYGYYGEPDDLFVDFGPGAGLWVWDYYSYDHWYKLHDLSPKFITTADVDGDREKDVIVDFGPGLGIWMANYWYYPDWTQIHSLSSETIAVGNLDGNRQEELIIDFGGTSGVWILRNNSSWTELHPLSPESISAGNMDAYLN